MDKIKTIHIITEQTRFKILQLLSEHHYCVRAISKKLNISESAVSQHMSILKKHNVVYGEKIGYQMHYKVNSQLLINLISDSLEYIKQFNIDIKIPIDCSCEFSDECIRNNISNKGDKQNE